MNINASVQKSDANYQAVMESIKFLKNNKILIGISEETAPRNEKKGKQEETASRNDEEDTPVNNAELLFIHTNGSPVKNIPPRPVLEPAIKHNQERIAETMKLAVDAAITGNLSGVMPALEATGMEGQNVARSFFTDSANGWKPNSPETIKRKNKGKTGKTNPLIDTEEMRKAITYIVREV